MTVTLWTLTKGQSGAIDGFDETLQDEYRIRLMELGFHPGEMVSCLQAPALGAPKVYRVANTVFSLDDEVASHVQVRPENND
ncbi:FeoA family protein [Congregibacter brevis]|uniref:FeoA family protein n=1 Tax=Congregibacter brevis TaxID=3081201 RepID=A0ABZ0I884_9GAMM|nr:FeoA family protein [Congregibacter sp. IMCC45268]